MTMPTTVHPTAFVAPECELAEGVKVGPYCVLSGRVRLESGVELIGSAYLNGPLTVGAGTIIYPFACLGFEGQDTKFKRGDPTAGVSVGRGCIIREHVTINASTKIARPTTLGDRGFMLVGAHIGHDAAVGDDAVLVNGSMVGGHAEVGSNVLLGGQAVIHQFTRVGRFAHVAGDSGVSQHLPPFCIANERNRIGGINRVALRRAGFPREHITALVQAYRDILRFPMNNDSAIAELRSRAAALNCPPLGEVADFMEAAKSTGRGIAPGMGKPPRDAVAWFKGARAAAEDLPPEDADLAG